MKYLNIKKVLAFVVVMMTVTMVSSCKEDEDLNPDELKVYINNQLYPINTINAGITVTPVGVICDMKEYKFPIRITFPSVSDIKVLMEIDEEYISLYNEKNGTNYLAMPKGSYTYTESATIKANESQSRDSINFSLSDLSKCTDPNGYIIPLKIKEIQTKDKNVQISQNLSNARFIISVNYSNINASATILTGDKIDRSSWIVETIQDRDYGKGAPTLIDNNFSTAWVPRIDRQLPIAIIDMGSEQNVKGLIMTPSYWYPDYYCVTGAEIYSSNDKANWKKEGVTPSYSKPLGSISNPSPRIIAFHKAVQARYFKIKVTSCINNIGGFSEIDAVK